jgi:hypothetical protein
MSWIEEESGVKFLCWGQLKPSLTENDAITVKIGESIEADILRITETDGDEDKQYKYRLQIEGEKKPIIMWSNASIKRQQNTLELKEGEHIRLTYIKDYETQFGQKGRQIKVEVNRESKKK